MIKNGICDSACNNALCGWDGLDCGCAPNCAYSDLATCKADCLVPNCNYGKYPGKTACADTKVQLAALNYHLSNRTFTGLYTFSTLCPTSSCTSTLWTSAQTTCQSKCNTLGCAYSQANCIVTFPTCTKLANCANCGVSLLWGNCLTCLPGFLKFFTKCVPSCPAGFALHTLVPSLCYPETDQSTEALPLQIYVQSTANPAGNGTYANPFDSLATALDTVWMKYTTVYLLTGTHSLTNTTFTPYLLSWTQKPVTIILPLRLTISGFLCEMDTAVPSHPLCAQSPPVLSLINTSPVILQIAGNVVIQRLTFWGGTTLLPGCDQERCSYCPTATLSAGVYSDDRGNTLEVGSFAPAALCTPFLSQRFIKLDTNANLTLSEVTFSRFMQGYRSLIYLITADLYLDNVNFTNITIGNFKKLSFSTTSSLLVDAVIVQDNTSGKVFVNKTLALSRVNATLINNGYEYGAGLFFGGFLTVQGMRNITIANSTFSYSLYFRSSTLTLGNFLYLSIRHCIFSRVYAGMFVVKITPAILPSLPEEFTMTHIDIRNLTFTRCGVGFPGALTSGGVLNIYMASSLLNILIEGLTFRRVYSQSTLLYIGKSTALTSGDMFGYTVLSKTLGVLSALSVPPKQFSMSTCRMSDTVISSATTLIYLINLAHVKLASITLTRSGDTNAIISLGSMVFVSLSPTAYLNRTVPNWPYAACAYPIYLRTLYNVTMLDTNIDSCGCQGSAGLGGVVVSGNLGGDLTIARGTLARLTNGPSSTAGCIHATNPGNIYLSDFVFDSNPASKGGCVQLQTAAGFATTVQSVSFINGTGYIGQLQLRSSQNATVTNCTFSSIRSLKEAGIYFSPLVNLNSSFLRITDSVFSYNSGISGVCVYAAMDTTAPSPLTFQLESCLFLSNSGTGSGTAVLLSSSNVLGPACYIRNSVFRGNRVSGAVLFLSQFQGTMEVRGVVCEDSELSAGDAQTQASSVGCINSDFTGQTETPPTLVLADSLFLRNAGVVIVSFTTVFGKASLVTSNNTFTANLGRAISLQQAILTDQNSTISLGARMGLYLSSASEAVLAGTKFTGNSGTSAGALYLGGASYAHLSACDIDNNTAREGSGAIYVEQSSELHIHNCHFGRNKAVKHGAAITFFGSAVNNTIDQSLFEANENGSGGTVLVLSSVLSLREVTFRRNTGEFAPGLLAYFAVLRVHRGLFEGQSSRAGSFIYIAINSSLEVSNSTFVGGWAETEGGALYILSTVMKCTHSSFADVSAGRGGLLYASSGANFTLFDVTAVTLAARINLGGVIYTAESHGSLQSVSLQAYSGSGIVGISQLSLTLIDVHMTGKC